PLSTLDSRHSLSVLGASFGVTRGQERPFTNRSEAFHAVAAQTAPRPAAREGDAGAGPARARRLAERRRVDDPTLRQGGGLLEHGDLERPVGRPGRRQEPELVGAHESEATV